MKLPAVTMYDALAPEYRQYSKRKKTYLHAIESLVIKNTDKNATNLLDLGAGDGVRSMSITKKLKIKDVVLVDPSTEMIILCRKLQPKQVVQATAQNFHSIKKFDLILCLWNVLGHIDTELERVLALSNMAKHLSDKGKIFLDVNNGCNIANYGLHNSFARLAKDMVSFNARRGDISFEWDIAGKKIPAKGHLFSPKEMKILFAKSGLSVLHQYTVNYQTGTVSYNPYQGQLFYILEKQK